MRGLVFLGIAVFLGFSSHPLMAGSETNRCFKGLLPNPAITVGTLASLITKKTPTFFKITDPTQVPGDSNPNPFHFFGWLDRNTGMVEFSLRTHLKTKEGLYRACWNGREKVHEMLNHFGLENVKMIKGVWRNGDNLETFDRLVATGMPPEKAASQTWTGRAAAREGFTEVKITAYDVNRGKTQKVVVVFSRP